MGSERIRYVLEVAVSCVRMSRVIFIKYVRLDIFLESNWLPVFMSVAYKTHNLDPPTKRTKLTSRAGGVLLQRHPHQ
jgi:hypothetical protein